MKFIVLLSISGALSNHSIAQQFITNSTLEFEKRINVHRLFDDCFEWVEEWRKYTPQFYTGHFELVFSQDRTLFQFVGEDTKPNAYEELFLRSIVYTNRRSSTYISQKKVFDELYLVQDSLPAIEWKITADMRTIAGFECRKAVGRFLDSLVVIAFYTDQIITSGGPESFSGLPGMILGIAIPRLHTTWYATRLQLSATKEEPVIVAPTKGEKITHAIMLQILEKKVKNQESNKCRQIFTWQVML